MLITNFYIFAKTDGPNGFSNKIIQKIICNKDVKSQDKMQPLMMRPTFGDRYNGIAILGSLFEWRTNAEKSIYLTSREYQLNIIINIIFLLVLTNNLSKG